MSTPTITNVSSCTTTACAFNDGGCNAYAITVGGENAAACGTFTTLDIRAGISDVHSEVGACHRLDCLGGGGTTRRAARPRGAGRRQ